MSRKVFQKNTFGKLEYGTKNQGNEASNFFQPPPISNPIVPLDEASKTIQHMSFLGFHLAKCRHNGVKCAVNADGPKTRSCSEPWKGIDQIPGGFVGKSRKLPSLETSKKSQNEASNMTHNSVYPLHVGHKAGLSIVNILRKLIENFLKVSDIGFRFSLVPSNHAPHPGVPSRRIRFRLVRSL